MAKVIALVDGFNMYHALDQRGHLGTYPYRRFKWINYRKLAACFVPRADSITSVKWFTAECPWKGRAGEQKRIRHRALIRANRSEDVEVVNGYFRPVTKTQRLILPRGLIQYETYEEKRSDVALAVTLASLALQQAYDKAVLITADSDMIPAVQEAKRAHSGGMIINAVPIERRARALANYVDQQISMRQKHLALSQFPDHLELPTGRALDRPIEWT